MKYYYHSPFVALFNLMIFFFAFSFTNCGNAGSGDNSNINESIAPQGLSVEFIRQPEGVFIIDSKPEFTWELSGSVATQTAYQILVASSEDLIDKNVGDIWDSGIAPGKQSINVEFNGTPLEAGNSYFWKVRVWGENGQETPFSKSQRFKVGENKGVITSANHFQVERIKPTGFKKLSDDSYFIDFGKDAFATLAFHYETKKIDTILVHIGEQLTDNRINRDPQGTIRYQKIKVPVDPTTTKYTLQIEPDKRNTGSKAIQLPDSFPVLMPFRYVEIEGAKENLDANDFIQLFYHSYWEDDASFFTSSDSTLNAVWDLCKYSIKATTFAGLYVDGDRERIPYEADAYLNQLSHYTTDREYAIARKTIEYFMEHPTWPTEWQLHVALMFHADYMYTGNTELIAEYYDELKYKTLMDLLGDDGLISSENATPEIMKKLGFKNPDDKLRDIVDWPPAQKDTGWQLATAEGERDGFVFKPVNTVVNCFYYKNLLIMAEFAEILNKTEEAAEFLQLALQVKKSINDMLFDEELGVYVDGIGTNHASLHSNMMAMAFNIVPEEHMPSVANFIKSRGMACSVYGSQYLLEALYNANESDYALELMTATHDRSWYNMIHIGSTITLEAWDMKYKPNADWNHAWGATPANIIPRYLWGFQPKTPGYNIAVIRPKMGTLTSSTIVVPTIRGKIKAHFTVHDDVKSYEIEIPANMSGEFYFEGTTPPKVVLNGEDLGHLEGAILLQSGKNILKLF